MGWWEEAKKETKKFGRTITGGGTYSAPVKNEKTIRSGFLKSQVDELLMQGGSLANVSKPPSFVSTDKVSTEEVWYNDGTTPGGFKGPALSEYSNLDAGQIEAARKAFTRRVQNIADQRAAPGRRQRILAL